jgi:ABC-type nitrate/sulfonate/bicarbonate transport system ATPase subunit
VKLAVKKLRKVFLAEQSNPLVAIEDIDLAVAQSEFVCLLGPSGCGKSTLLFIAAGLEKPTSGIIEADGKAVVGPGRERGMLFQQFALFPWRTARANVEFGLEIQGVARRERHERSSRWLSMMRLADFADSYPHQLSGGMQQRVAIARLLINDPDILLMDEPFAALDAQTRTVLCEELIRVWQETRRTVLFVTHSVDEAIFLADRVVVMTRRPGRIKADISIELPRPRDTSSETFNRYRREITGLIRSQMDDAG